MSFRTVPAKIIPPWTLGNMLCDKVMGLAMASFFMAITSFVLPWTNLSKMRLVDEPMAYHNQGASTAYSTRSGAGQLASWKTFSGLLIIVVGSEIVNILIEETLDFAVVPSEEMGPDNNGRLK
ncbi:hypothetical protein DKX38_015865 [Salix brachista]|uniref:Uncharacterized protein n=1 Tax=Salix brachista TaxID=2182728 RepID=A0A5N5L6L8_9ROSI|nr:hypothetical protein DKX38_015865 [Salix brachista]